MLPDLHTVGCKIKMQGLLLKNYKKVPDLNSIILNQRWDPLGIGPCAAVLLASLWSWLCIELYTLPDSSVGKESACNAEDPGSIPGSGRSTGEGKGYLPEYSGLENFMDCIVHGVANSDTTEWLTYFTYINIYSLPNMCMLLCQKGLKFIFTINL